MYGSRSHFSRSTGSICSKAPRAPMTIESSCAATKSIRTFRDVVRLSHDSTARLPMQPFELSQPKIPVAFNSTPPMAFARAGWTEATILACPAPSTERLR
jgi:hypothetical protein